jgi:beta-mannosidase
VRDDEDRAPVSRRTQPGQPNLALDPGTQPSHPTLAPTPGMNPEMNPEMPSTRSRYRGLGMRAPVDLSGLWKATVADDDQRRSGIGLDSADHEWTDVTVPGHWRTVPQFAESDGPLLYRRRFIDPVPPEGERRWVVFDGIFYQGDVWLDGAYLGDPEGYFASHAYDITALSRLGEEHVLAVEVTCSPQRDLKAKRNITGSFQHGLCIDPAWNPGGIWRGARIETTGSVRLDGLGVLCRDATEAQAHLLLHGRLDSDHSVGVKLRTYIDGVVVTEVEKSLAQGVNEVDWSVDIEEPRLWWPWALGEQHLTDVAVEVIVADTVSDRREVRTGLREVAMQDWVLSVNGERLFLKGANLVPTRAAIADATPEEVRRDVELAREAGLDMLRVHAHVARPELYEAADELGIVIWQDFPLQWGYARQVRREAARQAEQMVALLGHHPSIAVWCGHNEPMRLDGSPSTASPAAADVRAFTLPFVAGQQLPTWNRSVLDRWVKRAIERNDDTRPVIAHSGVMPHLPQLDGTDSHLWFGWHHGDERDLPGFAATMPRMVRFVSELGAQAVPTSSEFIDVDNWPDLDWQTLADHHGLQSAVFEQRVPPAAYRTFDEWRIATQQYQAVVLKHQIETLRRVKYRPTGGVCFYSLNDSQPMVSASVLDHERVPKLGFAAVVEACRPVIVVADRLPPRVTAGESLAVDVHVVSDLRRPLTNAKVTAHIGWHGGEHEWSWMGDVPADECVLVGTFSLVVPHAPGELVLDITLDADDVIATNRDRTTITR